MWHGRWWWWVESYRREVGPPAGLARPWYLEYVRVLTEVAWLDETQWGGERHADRRVLSVGGYGHDAKVSGYFRDLVLRDAGELPHGRTITTDAYTIRGARRGPGGRQQHDARRLRGNGGWCFMAP